MPRDWREATREEDGRFSGARFNVEEIPRLPTFPARWALEDPRRVPYLVFWTTEGAHSAIHCGCSASTKEKR